MPAEIERLATRAGSKPATAPFLAFTMDDIQLANRAWGVNCGPAALAACLGWGLERVRPVLGRFEDRGYMNPIMMREAVKAAGFTIANADPFYPSHGLVRLQFGGPWMNPEVNPRARYRYTHWIATKHHGGVLWAFDVNASWTPFDEWEREIVPRLVASYPRSDGGFVPTHLWDVRKGKV